MSDIEVFSQVIATLSEQLIDLIPGDKNEYLSNQLGMLSVLIYRQLDKNLIYLSGKIDTINKSRQILESKLLYSSENVEDATEDSICGQDNKALLAVVSEQGDNLTPDSEAKEPAHNTDNDCENVNLDSRHINEVIDEQKVTEDVRSITVSKRGRKIRLPAKLTNYDELLQGQDEELDSDYHKDSVTERLKEKVKRKVQRPKKLKQTKKEFDIHTDNIDENYEDTDETPKMDSTNIPAENVCLKEEQDERKNCKIKLLYETALMGKRGIRKYYEDRLPYKFFCDICSFKTKRESHYHKHKELHSANPDLKLHTCSKCEFTAIRLSVLQRHSLTHLSDEADILKCCECSYTTNSETALKLHRRRHFRKNRHLCSMCNFSTFYKQKLLKHLEKHSTARSESAGTLNPPRPGQTIQCNKCRYETSNKLNFLRHQRAVHLNQRPHLCDTCGMAFKRTDALRIHKEIHKDRSERKLPFICKICQKAFKSMAHLKEHMSVHTTERSFQCHICGQMFKTRRVQQRHLQGVHLKSIWVECSRCMRTFSSKYTLKRHLRQHDEENNGHLQVEGKIMSDHITPIASQVEGEQQDYGQDQDESATAIQTITITSDHLGEFTQQLQTVSSQLQSTGDINQQLQTVSTGDIAEVYIHGLENVASDINIVSIQSDDIGQILIPSSEPNFTEHVPQLSALVTDSHNTGAEMHLNPNSVKIYQSLTSDQGAQVIIPQRQDTDIRTIRTDFSLPVETFKHALEQLNSGTEANTIQLMNQVHPEQEVLNYETVDVQHIVGDGQIIVGANEGQFMELVTPDGQTYRIKVQSGDNILSLETVTSDSK